MHVHNKENIQKVFRIALFTAAKPEKNSDAHHQENDNLWFVHTMEYYTTVTANVIYNMDEFEQYNIK